MDIGKTRSKPQRENIRKSISKLLLFSIVFVALCGFAWIQNASILPPAVRFVEEEVVGSHEPKLSDDDTNEVLRELEGGIEENLNYIRDQAGITAPLRAAIGESGIQVSRGVDLDQSKSILLATTSQLLWYNYEEHSIFELSSGLGAYHGIFKGEVDSSGTMKTIWVIARMAELRAGRDILAEIDAEKGTVLQEFPLGTSSVSEVVRMGDRIFLCDRNGGRLIQLTYPTLEQVGMLHMAENEGRIASLSPAADDMLWILVHKLGKSVAVLINISTGQKVQTTNDIGGTLHGLVQWRDCLVTLDTKLARLIILYPSGGMEIIWEAPKLSTVLRGLVVIDDKAIFGLSTLYTSDVEEASAVVTEIVAVHLGTETLLWRKEVPAQGSLNIIAAPQLSVATIYRAMGLPVRSESTEVDQDVSIGGYWPSGLPYMDLELMRHHPVKAGWQLNLIPIDISDLLEIVQGFHPSVWDDDYQRAHNAIVDNKRELDKLKPGVKTIFFIFSDNSGSKAYWLPYFRQFQDALVPIVERILGPGSMNRIIRLQLANMTPGAVIKMHVDSGGYAKHGHRIHIPLTSPEGVTFEVCEGNEIHCTPIPIQPGFAFEVNNMVKHKVSNIGSSDRIHLIVDASEKPLEHQQLDVGDVCTYVQGDLSCQ